MMKISTNQQLKNITLKNNLFSFFCFVSILAAVGRRSVTETTSPTKHHCCWYPWQRTQMSKQAAEGRDGQREERILLSFPLLSAPWRDLLSKLGTVSRVFSFVQNLVVDIGLTQVTPHREIREAQDQRMFTHSSMIQHV